MSEETPTITPQTESKPISEDYLSTLAEFTEGNLKISQLQLETLNKMNHRTNEVYDKSLDKISKIKEEVKDTNEIYNKLKAYFSRIDEVGKTIDGMESSVDYLNIIIDRIESKFQDLDSLK